MRSESQMERTIWIICCGMRRGGSTLQYQLASAITGGRSVGLTSPEHFPQLIQTFSASGFCIVKCHKFIPEVELLLESGNVKILYVFRDVRDAVVSCMNKYGKTFYRAMKEHFLEGILGEFDDWNNLAGIYSAKYEDMIEDMQAEVRRIASYLGVDLDDEAVDSISGEYTLEKQKERILEFDYREKGVGEERNRYNPDNLLHFNHIKSGEKEQWRKELTRLQTGYIEDMAYCWLTGMHYKISQPWVTRKLGRLLFGFILPNLDRTERVLSYIKEGKILNKLSEKFFDRLN